MVESAELIKKLQIRAGTRVRLVDVPSAIADAVTAGAEVEAVKAGEACDGVLAFVETPADVAAVTRQALDVLASDGLLWFAYRKGAAAKASGLSRDTGWDALTEANWRPVRSIAIDETWTGLRFRPVELVKSDKPDAWRTRGQG